MGHHIDKNGYFQSDKYPWLGKDKIVLSFKDKHAREALQLYAELCNDEELTEDILVRLRNIKNEYVKDGKE